jgi:hypothetical protein
MSEYDGQVRMSTPSRSEPLERNSVWDAAVEPSERCTLMLFETVSISQHSTDDLPSGVRTKAVTRDLTVRGSSVWLC